MAARELHAIVSEAALQFGTRAIAVEHRSGFLAVGEISVAIAPRMSGVARRWTRRDT